MNTLSKLDGLAYELADQISQIKSEAFTAEEELSEEEIALLNQQAENMYHKLRDIWQKDLREMQATIGLDFEEVEGL